MKYLMKSNSFAESKRYLKLFEEIDYNLSPLQVGDYAIMEYQEVDRFGNVDATKKAPFWKIMAKEPYLSASLNKIGMNFEGIKSWENTFEEDDIEYILMYHEDTHIKGKDYWSWSGFETDNGSFERHKEVDQYMGEVEVTPEDIDNWEMKKNAKKYNL